MRARALWLIPLLILVIGASSAEGTGTASDVQYSYTGTELTVNSDVPDDYAWDASIKSDATVVIVSEGVASVGNNAFADFETLRRIVIPSSLTSLGDGAFSGCNRVVDLEFSSNNCTIGTNAFDGLGMTSTGVYVTFSNNVSTIPADLFRCDGVTNIREVRFLGTVTTIGAYAFYGCTGITSVPDTVTSIGEMAFYDCDDIVDLVLPEGLLSLGDDAFYRCGNIRSITFLATECTGPGMVGAFRDVGSETLNFTFGPEVKKIPEHLMSQNYTSKISSLEIPPSVTAIGDGAFKQYAGPDPVFLSYDSITSIGREAFAMSSGIETFTTGTGVTTIGDGAFDDCRGLKELTITASLNDRTEAECLFDSVGSTDTKVSFTGTRIPSYLFNGFDEMTELALVDTSVIGSHSLEGCTGLSSLSLSGITQVEEYGLAGSGLKDVTIPDGITLGQNALAGCLAESITVAGTLENVSAGALSSLPSLKTLTVIEYPGDVRFDDIMPNMCQNVALIVQLDEIGDRMFEDCSGITSLQSDARYIGQRAFANTSLNDVTVDAGTLSIGGGAFADITTLERIRWDVTSFVPLGEPIFEGSGTSGGTIVIGTPYVPAGVFEGSTIGNVRFATTINSVADGAFRNSGLTAADISFLTDVPNNLFDGCSSLSNVTLSTSLRSIGDEAFRGTALTRITFPPSLKEIGDRAFRDCRGLTSVEFLGHGVSVGDEGFAGSGLLMITVQSISSSGRDAFPSCGVILSSDVPQGTFAEGSLIYCDHPVEGFDVRPLQNVHRYSILGDDVILQSEYPEEMIPYPDRFSGWVEVDDIMTATWTEMPTPYQEPPDQTWIEVSAVLLMAIAAAMVFVFARR